MVFSAGAAQAQVAVVGAGAPTDLDRDGKTDLVVFDDGADADAGTWYILQGGTNRTTAFSIVWGGSDDRPVIGDFDGDGAIDIAVYDLTAPDAGTWYILQGGTGFTTAFSVTWGDGSEDTPVPGDYDGDGRVDIAVYDGSGADRGTWYILQGGTNFTTAFSVVWGDGFDIDIDRPVPADYDGDGRLDLAVFDAFGDDAGTWYILQGGTGFTTAFSVKWGDGVDEVRLPGDYDGDGRIDLAAFDFTGDDRGTWYILQGGTNFTTAFSIVWGFDANDDIPVPNDWDNDGRLDIAVQDVIGADTGTWYVLQGGTGFTTAFSFVWGEADDIGLSRRNPPPQNQFSLF